MEINNDDDNFSRNVTHQQLNEIITKLSELYSISHQEHMKVLNDIIERIERLEKTYVSINADLINQNIKMSELLNGKLEEPIFETSESNDNDNNNNNNNNQGNTKELFFYENNGKFCIYGYGTYDNKTKIKSLGTADWNSINKTWDVITTVEKIKETFPNIIEKQK